MQKTNLDNFLRIRTKTQFEFVLSNICHTFNLSHCEVCTFTAIIIRRGKQCTSCFFASLLWYVDSIVPVTFDKMPFSPGHVCLQFLHSFQLKFSAENVVCEEPLWNNTQVLSPINIDLWLPANAKLKFPIRHLSCVVTSIQ